MKQVTLSKVVQNCLIMIILAEVLVTLNGLAVHAERGQQQPLIHLLSQLVPWPHFVALGVIVGAADLLINYKLLLKLLPMRDERGDLEPLNLKGMLVYSAATAFSEEVLVRGVLQSILGVWLTSALFGLGHASSFQKVLWTLFWGMVYGIAVYLTDNLWVAIIPHMMGNFAYAWESSFLPRTSSSQAA